MAQEQDPRYQQVVTKAWTDPTFKQRLLADPATVLREHGIDVPAGVELEVIEPTAERAFFVLPPKPAAYGELSDEQLAEVAGGFGDGSVRSISPGGPIPVPYPNTGTNGIIAILIG